MARERLLALAVGLQYPLIGVRRVVLHPGQQRRPEVEADAGVVVDDLCDPASFVEDPRGAVGQITLGGNALVPVVVGRGGILRARPLPARGFRAAAGKSDNGHRDNVPSGVSRSGLRRRLEPALLTTPDS